MHSEELTWTGFDGPRFQRFCNALIHYTVSKSAKLYTAPGRDGGIDQFFVGRWSEYDGKFRFQDKFHGGVERKKGFSLLKMDVVKDIREHAIEENIIVYITDVSLNNSEVNRLEKVAETELRKLGNLSVSTVLFWHGGVLDTMVRLAPLLWNQFFDTNNPLLEDYLNYFKPQLENSDLRYQLSNPFLGRKNILEQMSNFLAAPDTTLAVSGRSGIGKTRAVLHFFKTVVDEDDDWIAVVLKPEGYTAAGFANLLTGDRNLIILFDDADRGQNWLRSIKAEIDKQKGKVKLILTCSGDRYQEVKLSMPSYSRDIQHIQLNPLDPVETKEVYRTLLPGHPEKNLIWLRDKSSGVPGMIVAHCYLIREEGHPFDIPEEEGFQDYVKSTFDGAITAVKSKTSLEERKIRAIIEAIALVAPLPAGEDASKALASMLSIPECEIEEILSALADTGLVTTGGTIAIKPDPVSDTILRNFYDRAPSAIKRLVRHPDTAEFFGNMVDNLSIFKLDGGDHRHFIDGLLAEYAEQIGDDGITEQRIRNILHSALRLVFRMPEVGIRAVEKFLVIYSVPSHPLHATARLMRESPLQKLRQEVGLLLGRLFHTAPDYKAFPRLFTLFRQCLRVLKQPSLIYPCFGYTEYDFESSPWRLGPCCYRQLFLASVITPYFISEDAEEVELALSGFECLFKLDYPLEEAYDPAIMQISYGQGFLQDCSHTRKVRLQLLEGLIAFHRKHRSDAKKVDKWMQILSRVLSYQFTLMKPELPQGLNANIPTRPQAKPTVDQAEEVRLVYGYFRELLSGEATMAERALIKRYNSIGQTDELKGLFVEIHDDLERLLAPTSLDHRLELFLTVTNIRTNDRKEQLRALAQEYTTAEEFVKAIKAIVVSNRGLDITALNELALYLGEKHLDDAKELLLFVIDQVPAYASVFCRIADYMLLDEADFFKVVEKIATLDKQYSPKGTIACMLLSSARIQQSALSVRDMSYIESAVKDNELGSQSALDYNLYRYVDCDSDRGFELLMAYANKHQYRSPADIIFSITSDAEFCGRHQDKIMALFEHLLKYIHAVHMDFRTGLYFIRKYHGDQALFKFVTDDVCRRADADYYSFELNYYKDLGTYADRCRLYSVFLDWLPTHGMLKKHVKRDLLHFFSPLPPVNDEEVLIFEDFYRNWIDKETGLEALKDISSAIRSSMHYDERTLLLQCRLIDRVFRLFPSVIDADEFVGANYIDNSNSTRHTVGRGKPYAQDVQKKGFLEHFLQKHNVSTPIAISLNKALARVNKEIEANIRPVEWEE